MYAPNYRASKHMKKKLTELKGERDKSTIGFGDFNTPLLVTDRTRRQKVRRDSEEMNNMINHLDLIGIYRTLHPTTAGYTTTHEAFTKMDQILGHKTNLNQFKYK